MKGYKHLNRKQETIAQAFFFAAPLYLQFLAVRGRKVE